MPSPAPPTQEARLLALLGALGSRIRHSALRARREGRLRRTTRTYNVWKASYFPPGGLSAHYITETRQEWDWAALHEVVSAFREQESDLFTTAAHALAEIAKLNRSTALDYLQRFLFLAGQAAVHGSRTSSFRRLAQRLAKEAAGGDLRWGVTLWLCGISTETEFSLGQDLLIRAPRSSDFDLEVPSDSLGLDLTGWHLNLPSAMLEVARSTRNEIRQIVNSLCLFRVGSVSVIKQTESSLLAGGKDVSLPGRPTVHFSYRVCKDDQRRLRSFLSRIAPHLPPNPTGVHSDPRSGARSVGLKHYFRAVHDAADAEERVAQGVAALEAILVGKKEGELQHRLAQRTAALLQFAGLNAIEVYSRMKRAYELRSEYVHGALSTVKGRAEAEATCKMILYYARLSLLKYLEVDRWWEGGRSRDRFLQDLDESLLDATGRRALGKELSGGYWELAPPKLGGDGDPQ
jgi:hypothetical protein